MKRNLLLFLLAGFVFTLITTDWKTLGARFKLAKQQWAAGMANHPGAPPQSVQPTPQGVQPATSGDQGVPDALVDDLATKLFAVNEAFAPVSAGGTTLALQQAVVAQVQKTGDATANMSMLRPAFIYDEIERDGKKLLARPFCSIDCPRAGASMTMGLMEILHSIADDPKAELVVINKNPSGSPVANATFSAELTRAQVAQLIQTLLSRGKPDMLPRWDTSRASNVPQTAQPAQQQPSIPRGNWHLRLMSVGNRPADVSQLLQRILRITPAQAQRAMAAAPVMISDELTEDLMHRAKGDFEAAGATVHVFEAPPGSAPSAAASGR